MSKFSIKFSNSIYFPDHMIWFIFGMMTDKGPRFNSAIPVTLRSRSWTWNFYVKVLNSSYFPDHDGFGLYLVR